ncbi:UDP-glucuronosyltransferase 2A3-like isoform X3 [Cimex lectularius]|uniref:UDP-glucuronosyltransferase n=1 Tax=Cimex lectularius TaxID=79782 RepID=A0A8I6SEG7_CIMLE|nr:UDP-glucuronosyltransferase 2A3-like isoform X3 [Cimex lectularius]
MDVGRFLVILLVSFGFASCSRILGVFPYFGKSHFSVFQPLMEELAKRGHQVTVFSYFPRETPLDNYTDVVIPPEIGTVGFLEMGEIESTSYTAVAKLGGLHYLRERGKNTVDAPGLKILEKMEFDLSIIELFNTDVFYPLLYKIGAPVVGITSHSIINWHQGYFANPDSPSVVPTVLSAYSDKMSLPERFCNTMDYYISLLVHRWFFLPQDQALAEKRFGKIPPIEEMTRNTTLLLANTHFSLFRSRPISPSIVEVGGIHVKEPKPLPEKLQKVLDESKGVIYFSMGSVLKGDSMSMNKQKAFIKVFSELKQTVLWKRETPLEEKVNNIVTNGWFPQRDILAHPKVQLFISHGGLLSTNEAVTSGVPMVVVPMFGDQHHNAKALESIGFAVSVDFNSLTEDDLRQAVNKVLNDPSYKENARKTKEAFLDRPMSPLDTAVYWVEYVIRHKGAPHLRSAARDMTWYQYHNLDVYASLALMAYFAYLIVKNILKFLLGLCCGRVNKHKTE